MNHQLVHRFLLLLFACLLVFIIGTNPLCGQSAGNLDLSFQSGSRFDGSVNAIAKGDGGQMYIGGLFHAIHGNTCPRIARLNADGTVDTTFNPGLGPGTTVGSSGIYQIVRQTDGKLLISGVFDSYDGTARNRLARINADGSLDTSFVPPTTYTSGAISRFALQTDGKVLIFGSFTSVGSTPRNRIARLNSDGSFDASFDPGLGTGGTSPFIAALAVQADQKILISGTFTSFNGVSRNRIARLNANGTLDTSFDPGTGAGGVPLQLISLSLQSSGKVIVGGRFATYDGTTRNGITRLNTDGTHDSTFAAGTGLNSGGNASPTFVQSDDKILVGGFFTSYNGTPRNHIARLNADGSLDASFNPGPGLASGGIQSFLPVSDGKVIIGGGFTSYAGIPRLALARINDDGSLDSAFNAESSTSGADDYVRTLALQPDGKLVIGGSFEHYHGVARNRLARVNPDGSLDTSFVPATDMEDSVDSLIIQDDGKILVGGDFTIYNGATRNRLVRLHSNGSFDPTFNIGSGFNDNIYCMALQPDGKVLVAGDFTKYNGVTRNKILRLNTNGTLDASFNPGTGPNNNLRSIAIQNDGKILIGGRFTEVSGASAGFLARLNPDGSRDASFNPSGASANNSLTVVAVQPDDKILIGGYFTLYNGTARVRIARLNHDGTLDLTFNVGSGTDDYVNAFTLLANGKILIGGHFTTYNGATVNHLARLNPDGSRDTSFQTGSGAQEQVHGYALTADGAIHMAGDFLTYNEQARSFLARLFNDSPTHTLTSPSSSQVLWTRTGPEPEVTQVHFEFSTNGNAWTPLGAAARVAGGWHLTGLSMPPFGFLKARARAIGGYFNAATSLIEFTSAFGTIPDMAVFGNDEFIADGATAASPANGTDFGAVPLLNTQETRFFTVSNNGASPLLLNGMPQVEITGPHADDFRVSLQPASPVAVDDRTTFAIDFDPKLPGLRSATVSIASNHPSFNPYTFAISGVGALSKPHRQVITFLPPAVVYDSQGALTLAAESSSGLPVTLELLSGPATLAGSVLSPTGFGKVKVRASQVGDALHAAARPVTRTISFKADPASLTLINLVQRYTGTPRPIAVLGAASMPDIEYQVAGAFTATPPTSAGKYTVRATADGKTKTGKLTITPAPLHVTPQNARKFAGEANPPLMPVYDGFLGSDNASILSPAPALQTNAKTTSPGGLYPITSRGGAAPNYQLIHRVGTLVVESFTGGYQALLVESGDLPAGLLKLTIDKSGQGFSGALPLAAELKPLSCKGPLTTLPGSESATGSHSVTIGSTTYDLAFTLSLWGDLTGTLTADSTPFAGTERGRRLLTLPKGKKAPFAGAHTALLEPSAPATASDPPGSGWARATINSKGTLALAGKLGDGTSFTAALPADSAAHPGYCLFAQPYKPARIDSFIGGSFQLLPHPSLPQRRHLPEADLTWSKTGQLKDPGYRSGFPPLNTVLLIDPWQKPGKTTPLTQLLGTPGPVQLLHSPTGSASQGDLPATITLTSAGKFNVPAPNTTKWQLKLNPATGTFTGGFELLDAGAKRKVPISGALRQPALPADNVIGEAHYLLPPTNGALTSEKTTGNLFLLRP